MNAVTWIGVALIGGCGAIARVSVDAFAAKHLTKRLTGPGPRLAAGTFVVNMSGAFLLGLLDGLALSGDASIIFGTALVGAYTTFSTWMLQSEVLRAGGHARAAVINVAASLLVGFGAVALGHALGAAL